MASVKEVIKKARKYYFEEWRGNEKICPAFGEKVYLTRLGWNHIAHHPRRKLVDKIIRLRRLPLAREILESATTYQTVAKTKKYYLYGFQAVKDNLQIKIVVASKGPKGKKILFSVMFKSLNKTEQRKIRRHNQKIIREFRKNYPLRRPKRRSKR